MRDKLCVDGGDVVVAEVGEEVLLIVILVNPEHCRGDGLEVERVDGGKVTLNGEGSTCLPAIIQPFPHRDQ